MNSTVFSLALVSVGFAGWMWYLARRATTGALRSGPGIRVPATKVCEHTWEAAQVAAAPRYTKLAINQTLKQAATVAFDVATALEIVTFQSADHREALAALREKRKPKFEGR